jgi:intracellular septation protein A
VLTIDPWINVKVPGVTIATMVFVMAQAPLLACLGVKMD